MTEEAFFVFIIIIFTIGIFGIALIPENHLTKDKKAQIIDCQSRGNDLGWCLEVIK